MTGINISNILQNVLQISNRAKEYQGNDRCLVAPSPELFDQIQKELARVRKRSNLASLLRARTATPPGMNDGMIYPSDLFPLGTPIRAVREAAANRAPLRGTVRVIVVLVQFSDRAMNETRQHFEDLFFSIGTIATGSVREYFREVTNNLIDVVGEVAGPFTMPLPLSDYAHGDSGTGLTLPNAQTMALDSAVAANPTVDFSLYDNNADTFVDAFIVIHAGPGAEVTGSVNDIWSHKWVLPSGAFTADAGTKIFAYLTVPEDSRIGVCAHELGHLLFGFPDLYDTDYSSAGIGDWCLMAGGSWNGGGDTPAHPSAWCKADQGWVTVINQTTNANNVSIEDVKTNHQVIRLWKDGAPGSEYFLLENRQRSLFDSSLPGEGLLMWHIDDSIPRNTDENHPKVALEQADGNEDLEKANDRGDLGDPFPGSSNNRIFNGTSNPNSQSYTNVNTCVEVTNISAPGPVMTADITVKCGIKVLKEGKDIVKDFKDRFKDKFEKDKFEKEKEKDFKDKEKDFKEFKDFKEKEFEKPGDKPGEGVPGGALGAGGWSPQSDIEARLAALEARLAAIEPFIASGLRPDLRTGALAGEEDLESIRSQMQKGGAIAKREYDAKPPER